MQIAKGSVIARRHSRSVPNPELQLDIPINSRQDAPMVLFQHRRWNSGRSPVRIINAYTDTKK
jgi:hypothetical protein